MGINIHPSPEKDDSGEFAFSNWHFTNTIKDIFHTMTGLEMLEEKYDPESRDLIEQITGVIILVGQKNMMITLSMPERTAYLLVEFMTGMQAAEVNTADLYDGVSELANMVAGQSKAKLAQSGSHYTYLPPFIIAGDNHMVLHKKKVAVQTKKYKAVDAQVIARIYFM